MNELTILHLSDLHIEEDTSTQDYSRTLKTLIEHIACNVINVPDHSLVVAVTGDVLDRGNSKARGASTKSAENFFKDLYDRISAKVAGIVIVPGNHDKARNDEDSFLIYASRELIKKSWTAAGGKTWEAFGEQFLGGNGNKTCQPFWNYIQRSYADSGYIGLLKKIYSKYGMQDRITESDIERTFGVVPLVVNGICVFFVLLNTAWCCTDNSDNRQIVLGDFQRKEIMRQYNIAEKTHGKPDLTICLGHHPLSMLDGNEETETLYMLSDNRRMTCNAYLCGHMHERNTGNSNNSSRSSVYFNTFMTGLGGESADPKNDTRQRYYAFYTFNMDLQSIDIYPYRTSLKGEFVTDLDLFPGRQDGNEHSLVYPISMADMAPYIRLTVCRKLIRGKRISYTKSFTGCYISEELKEKFTEYEKGIEWFQRDMRDELWIFKKKFLEEKYPVLIDGRTKKGYIDGMVENNRNIQRTMLARYFFRTDAYDAEEDNNLKKAAQELLGKTIFSDFKHDLFYKYMVKLCDSLMLRLASADSGKLIRFHLRYLSDIEHIEYSQLCISVPDIYRSEKAKYNMKPLGYKGLIEASDMVGDCLLYSANKHLVGDSEKPNARWADFITVIPKFSGSRYEGRTRVKQKDGCPVLTFGTSIEDREWRYLLYFMQEYDIGETISSVIESFIDVFPIDWTEFSMWANRHVETNSESTGYQTDDL